MKVFLSHSSQDKDDVRRLAEDLRDHGVKVWLDEWEIKVGDHIIQKTQKGIADSDFLAIWLTVAAVMSHWVEREWMAKYHAEVVGGRVAVLPLLADGCEVPALLRDKRYADFRSDYFEGLDDLLEVLLPDYERNDTFVKALANIKERTTCLWDELRWLPINERSNVSCEIRHSTLRSVLLDLETLAQRGHIFTFRYEVAYQMQGGENVYDLVLERISADLGPLIARASHARICGEAQSMDGVDGRSAGAL